MRTFELFETKLDSIADTMLLMHHGKLTYAKAAELLKKLEASTIFVAGARRPANLEMVEDKKTGTLRFVSSKIPGSWRSGASAVSRYHIQDMLRSYGFTSSTFPGPASKRQAHMMNGPHIYFWGPGTDAPKTEDA